MEKFAKRIRSFAEYASAFIFGGIMYGACETLARGYTHPSMLITGGACFAVLYAIGKHKKLPLLTRALLGSLIITTAELIAGCICNLWLGWGVWDYSHLHPNLWGQICLPFSILWALLSIPAFGLASILRRAVGGGTDQLSVSASAPASSASSSESGSSDEPPSSL